MSILSHLADGGECPYDVQFLYSTKTPAEGLNSEKILFLERLAAAYGQGMVSGQLRLFLTSPPQDTSESISRELLCNGVEMPFMRRRMALEDVAEALGPKEVHGSAIVYVCGVPSMTDEFVEKLTSPAGLGLRPEQVFCEKWW